MKTTLKISIIALLVMLTISFANIASAQTTPVPQGKVFDLDAADRVPTTNKAIFNGKEFKVYVNKSGRLYIETGVSKKTGKPTRKYLTPAAKKEDK